MIFVTVLIIILAFLVSMTIAISPLITMIYTIKTYKAVIEIKENREQKDMAKRIDDFYNKT